MSELLSAEEITKAIGWWKKETIVDRVSLNLHAGEIIGLLGPNGAGKTTTMKMILGLTSITSGQARMFGKPVPTPASRVGAGFLPEAIQHPDHLSVEEYLKFHARLSDVSDSEASIEEQLRQVEMFEHRHRLLKDCSKGMRQRADIARLLLRKARLIFLDEPFSGLDPCGQVMLKKLLLLLKEQQIGILVNSHAAGILADVCDRVCIMNKGKVVVSDSLEALTRTPETLVAARFSGREAAVKFVEETRTGNGRVVEPDRIEFDFADSTDLNEFVQRVISSGGQLIEVTPVRLTLDQLFVKVLAGQKSAVTGGLA